MRAANPLVYHYSVFVLVQQREISSQFIRTQKTNHSCPTIEVKSGSQIETHWQQQQQPKKRETQIVGALCTTIGWMLYSTPGLRFINFTHFQPFWVFFQLTKVMIDLFVGVVVLIRQLLFPLVLWCCRFTAVAVAAAAAVTRIDSTRTIENETNHNKWHN